MIQIKVPATTANIGPGFDCLGMALNMHLIIQVEKEAEETSFIWEEGLSSVPLNKNLIYQTIMNLLTLNNYNGFFKVTVKKNDIPISRGLGSSASAIVAGVYAANYILNNMYSDDELLNLACDIEGHPDNIVPAIKGGLQISKKIDSKYITSEVGISDKLKFLVYIPDFLVSTEEARAILPKKYDKEDVFDSIANIGFLINALNSKNYEFLNVFLDDKLHQPYRIKLINNGEDILKKSKKLGSIGEFISGSGPTLISIIKDNKDFLDNMKSYLNNLDDNWKTIEAKIDNNGVEIEVKNE